MSRYSRNSQLGTGVSRIAAAIATAAANQGNQFIPADSINAVVGLESIDVLSKEHTVNQTNFESVQSNILDAVVSLEGDDADVEAIKMKYEGDLGLEAATIVGLGYGDAGQYYGAANVAGVKSADGVEIIPDSDSVPALEAFDQSEIASYKHYSMAFNLEATQQDAVGELFFPTIVLTPDVGGIDVAIDKTFVMGEQRHATNGDVTDFNKVNVLNAISDDSILDSKITKLIPVVLEGGKNADKFVSEIGAETIKHDGVEIKTNFLRSDINQNLLGITSGSPLHNGNQLTDEDALDSVLSLQSLAVKVYDKTDDKTSYIALQLDGLPRTAFSPSVEQETGRNMRLNFSTVTIPVSSSTVDVANAAAEALAGLGQHTVNLAVEATTTTELETATTKKLLASVEINNIYGADGSELAIEGATETLVNRFEFTVIGYKIDATHSNVNHRYRGKLGTTETLTERYAIGNKAPFSAKAPTAEADKRLARDLKTITELSRIKTQNDAVITLVERVELIKRYAEAVKGDMPTPAITGAGRHYVNAYYKEMTIDCLADIKSDKSHERSADFSAMLINGIRALAYPAAQDSNYQTVLETITNGRETKPHLAIATDSVIQRFLMESGDERTTSIGMDHTIAVSPNKRLDGKVIMSFVRPNMKGKADPLSFGCHGWIPTQVSTAQMTLGGSQAKHTTIQTRNKHISFLPIAMVINVLNIAQGLAPTKAG